MTASVLAYYRHARSLGAFSASACLALAREAAVLDAASYIPRSPDAVAREVMPDDSAALHLSFGIYVF